MTDDSLRLPDVPPPEVVLLPASNDVQLEGVEQRLVHYAVHLAYLHWLLFAAPLIVMSGRDREHSASAMHFAGQALDLHTDSLEADEALLFHALIAFSAPARLVDYTVGRAPGGERFVHLEVAKP